MMKLKTIASALTLCAALTASAEGYQINTLSARQNGMGHVGTAMHLGSESQIFNPAGLTSLEKNLEITGSFTGIIATASASNITYANSGLQTMDGRYLIPASTHHYDQTFTTDNSMSTPLSATIGFSITDKIKAGLAFYTPYGSGINWTDNWPGAVLNQSVSLKTFTVQPTVAWQPVKGLSVGVGLMITWGNVNLNKGLVDPLSFNAMQKLLLPAEYYYEYSPTTIPASINLNGSASVAAGANVGVMWDINPKWTVGFSYRSKMMMKVKAGDASLSYANEHAATILNGSLGIINNSQFKAAMPCAAVYNFGVSYKPIENLIVAFDAQLTGWSAYKSLDIEFLDQALSAYNQHIEKNYRDSWTFHLGAEYGVNDRFDVRAGLMIDTSPVSATHYNPETPGMTKIEPSAGISFSPVKNFTIDASLMYVAGLGAKNRSCTYPDVILNSIGQRVNTLVYPATNTFTADYHVHSWCPSIGFTLNF